MAMVYLSVCKRGHDISTPDKRNKAGCKECGQLRTKNRTPDHIRLINWKTYGILNEVGTPFTINDYNRLFQIQGGRCKICNKHQSEFKIALSVDHDHATGKVRGLLCNPCNFRLGAYEIIKTDAEKYLNGSL